MYIGFISTRDMMKKLWQVVTNYSFGDLQNLQGEDGVTSVIWKIPRIIDSGDKNNEMLFEVNDKSMTR